MPVDWGTIPGGSAPKDAWHTEKGGYVFIEGVRRPTEGPIGNEMAAVMIAVEGVCLGSVHVGTFIIMCRRGTDSSIALLQREMWL